MVEPKRVTEIKREKIGKEFFVVARMGDKIFEKIKWSPKPKFKNGKNISLSLDGAKRKFKSDNTFTSGRTNFFLTNVIETVQEGKEARPPKAKVYQYFVQISDGEIKVSARSQQHKPGYPKEKARDEAWESVLERLSQAKGDVYDADVGKKFFEKKDFSVKEGLVWYSAY